MKFDLSAGVSLELKATNGRPFTEDKLKQVLRRLLRKYDLRCTKIVPLKQGR